MAIRREHRVTFYSPGTMFSEVTSKPIPAWDTRMAVGMAEGIVERHDARPYGFRFETFMVGDPVPDGEGRVLEVKARLDKSSGMHFLGGSVRTFAQVMADDRPEEKILRSNMRGNRIPAVIENRNSYRTTLPFEEDAVIVGPDGEILDRASNYLGVLDTAEKDRPMSEKLEELVRRLHSATKRGEVLWSLSPRKLPHEANVFEIEIGGLIIEVSRRGLPKITIMDSDLQHQIESGQGIGELDSLYELVRRTVLRVDDALDVLLDALPEEGTS
jgi:hypothetical protein